MRYLLFVVLAAFTLGSVADTKVPNIFTDGAPAKALACPDNRLVGLIVILVISRIVA